MHSHQSRPEALLVVGECGGKLREALAAAGIAPIIAASAAEAQPIIQHRTIDLAILRHKLPDSDAIQSLSVLKNAGLRADAIVVADKPEPLEAIEALRLGATDYAADSLPLQALPGKPAPAPYEVLWTHFRKRYGFDHLASRNPATREAYVAAARVARGDASVLIEGETGTGKEYLARSVHYLSDRRDERFVTINCAAIPEALLESELFGHEKGAFTSATARKLGLCEEAHRGTLFLDEIGEMPLVMQVKLLRFLQERSFMRLGGTQPIDVDVRIIAATNQDLERRIGQGTFREDLFYRLNVLPLRLPALRHRPEDILPFARHCLRRHRKRCLFGAEEFSPRAEEELLRHDWPGNLRELDNVVQRAMLLAEGKIIEPRHLRLRQPRQAAFDFGASLPRLSIAAA